VILEASERLGGKVRTGRFDAAPVAYEVGAAELYDNSPVDEDPLADLVAELGLPVTEMAGQAVELGGELLANLDDLEAVAGPRARAAVLGFDARARGRMAPRQFYDSDQGESFVDERERGAFASFLERAGDPDARRYLRTLIHSDLATDPTRTGMRYGLQNYLMNDPAYMQLYSIDGGNERLIDELAARLRAEVRLGTRVRTVEAGPEGRLRVHAEGEAGGVHEFDHLVLCLPQPQLAGLRFVGGGLPAEMERHLAHHDHPADYLRVTVLFERPYWRGVLNESFLMLEAFGGCCLYDESSRTPDPRHGVLGWLIAGDAARDLEGAGDEELVAAALGSLPPALAEGRDLVLEARVHRWIGSVSALPGGRHPLPVDLRHRPAPHEAPGLLVVGDYLYDSTLNGVLESAEYAAREIAGALAAPAAPEAFPDGTDRRPA
jgi:protoporphyrinogen oxidase